MRAGYRTKGFDVTAGSASGWLRRYLDRFRLGRRLRTPLFLQLQVTDCGAACLGAVLAHYGRWVGLEELRTVCKVGRDGCTAADILEAADHYGLKATGWRKELSELAELPLPAILFWEFNHFVVLEGIGDGVYLNQRPRQRSPCHRRGRFRPQLHGNSVAARTDRGFSRRRHTPRHIAGRSGPGCANTSRRWPSWRFAGCCWQYRAWRCRYCSRYSWTKSWLADKSAGVPLWSPR